MGADEPGDAAGPRGGDAPLWEGRLVTKRGQEDWYVTERGVFRLTPEGHLLTEIAPGIDLERDLQARIGFRTAPDLREMDPRILQEGPMGLTASADW